MSAPKLRFPEFLDSGDWEERRLGDVCDRIMDGTHFSPKSKSGSCLYLTSKNIQNGIIDLSNISYISEEEHKQIYKRCPVLKNDVLLTKDGVNTGNCAINNLDFEFSLLSSVAVLRVNQSLLNHRFLYQLVLSEKTQRIITGAISGQAITRITLEKIGNFSVWVTNLLEQQKIADCLTSIADRITAETQKLATLKAHKKGLMQQLFPAEGETLPKLRFPEFRNSGDWEIKQLKLVCYMQAGKFISASDISEQYENGLYPCYGGNGLRGYTKTYTHSGKYPLIGRQGALCGNVNFGINQFHATEHAIVVTPKDNINVNWLFYELGFLNLNRYAIGQAQPGISVQVLEKISIVVPDIEKEQKKIADCLSSLDDLITAQAEKINTLKTHKKGLMQQLFPSI
jgi:type I restriction enzyme S subunit